MLTCVLDYMDLCTWSCGPDHVADLVNFNPSEMVTCFEKVYAVFSFDSIYTKNNKDKFLEDFLVLKGLLQNYKTIPYKCFLDTTCIMVSLPILKGLIELNITHMW